MMTLPLNNGLPVAGRELDYFIATQVLKQSPPDTRHADVFRDYEWFKVGEYHWERKSPDDFEHPGMYPVRIWPAHHSTTSAFFQVMEAMLYPQSNFAYEWWVYFDQYDLEVKLVHPYGQEYEVKVKLRQYKEVVEAQAHAVCAAVWKAKGGEGD